MRVTFSENNSGGSWWLDAKDYFNLLESGKWGLAESSIMAPFGGDLEFELRHHLVGEFESIDAAIAHWQSITGESANTEGCECCGPPYTFYYGEQNGGPIHYYNPEDVGLMGIRKALQA